MVSTVVAVLGLVVAAGTFVVTKLVERGQWETAVDAQLRQHGVRLDALSGVPAQNAALAAKVDGIYQWIERLDQRWERMDPQRRGR
jgi:hypothetical protein